MTKKRRGPCRSGVGRGQGGEDAGQDSSPPELALSPSSCPALSPWQEKAWQRWPDAYWIKNDGPWAVISTCSAHVRITLHHTRARAKEVKKVLDERWCLVPIGLWGLNRVCDPDKHVIVALRREEVEQ